MNPDSTAVPSQFHHQLVIGDTASATTAEVIAEFLMAMKGLSNALGICSAGNESVLVDLTDFCGEAQTLVSLVDTVRETEHIVWVLLVNSASAVNKLHSAFGNNPAPGNLCIAFRPITDPIMQQQFHAEVTAFVVSYRAMWLGEVHDLDLELLTSWQCRWVIVESNVKPDERVKIRAVLSDMGLPMLELGAEESDTTLRSHPFPKEWNLDFHRAGVPVFSENLITQTNLNSITSRFSILDSQVRMGIRSGIEAGFALKEIRDHALWLDGGYATWNDYCVTLLEVSRSYINRVIMHAEITDELSNNNPPKTSQGHPILPAGEAQSRPLKRLKLPTQRAKVWRSAVKSARGTMPTQQMVTDAVNSLLPPKSYSSPQSPSATKGRKWLLGLRSIAENGPSTGDALRLIDELEIVLFPKK